MLAGSPVVGFRSADGSIVMQSPRGAVRLAALDRPDGSLQPIDLQLPGTAAAAPIGSRSGALPATALAALQMALEQTANASGYQLPMMRIVSAPDALDVGGAMDLTSFDDRRTQVRLAGPTSWYDGGAGNQVAQLVLSMPFPNQGELHVGTDLSEALQAYLGGQVQPASTSLFAPTVAAGGALGAGAGGLMLKLRGGGPGAAGADDLPLDWSGLHLEASQKARDAVVTLDLPDVQPLIAGSSSVSGLPILLQRALAQTGDWTPGPGAPMPGAIRELALRGPFDAVAGPELISFGPTARPLNPGEEEIRHPDAALGPDGPRADVGDGPDHGLADRAGGLLAADGNLPPGGAGGRAGGHDRRRASGNAGHRRAGRADRARGRVPAQAQRGDGDLARRAAILGRVAMDDGETVVSRRGRIRIGAPIQPPPPSAPSTDSVAAPDSSYGQGSDSILSQGGPGSDPSPAIVSGSPQTLPSVDAPPSGTFVDGTFTGADSASGAATSSGGSSMAGALTSAMQMSADVDARTSMPSRPAIGQGSSASASAASGSGGSFRASAQAAGQAQAAGSAPSSPAVVSSGGASGTSGTSVSGAGTLPSAGGSDQTLVTTAVEGSVTGAQAGAAVADMSRASSSAASAASGSSDSAPSSFITGLQPGMWSGHRRDTLGYQSWRYTSEAQDLPQSSGGVDLGSLSKPVYPSLPTSLRFRYVGAPLWWSGSTRSGAVADGGDEGEDSSPTTRAMRAGLRAATSAASIWRSILVAGPRWGGPEDDLSGGMDSGRDANADAMSSLARGFDALTAGTLVGGGAVAGAAAGGAGYVAVTGSGSAGTLSKSAAARARADSVEMSIVAAIPPAPPPLESMGSVGTTGGDVPHARGKGHGHGGHKGKEDSDAVSHSKIGGLRGRHSPSASTTGSGGASRVTASGSADKVRKDFKEKPWRRSKKPS